MIITVRIVTYLFNTKFDANNMNRENSFPWQVYPRFAISKARRPNPAPGTKICTSDGVLEIQLSFDIFLSRACDLQGKLSEHLKDF